MSGQTKYVNYENGQMVVTPLEGCVLTNYEEGMPIELFKSFDKVILGPNYNNYEYASKLYSISFEECEQYLMAFEARRQEIIQMFLNLNNNESGTTF